MYYFPLFYSNEKIHKDIKKGTFKLKRDKKIYKRAGLGLRF